MILLKVILIVVSLLDIISNANESDKSVQTCYAFKQYFRTDDGSSNFCLTFVPHWVLWSAIIKFVTTV